MHAPVYDYMLRGSNYFQADVQAAGRILSAVPEISDCAWSNRGFHQRAAKWIAEHGVGQFLDIGSPGRGGRADRPPLRGAGPGLRQVAG
jgi:hypothetical protein